MINLTYPFVIRDSVLTVLTSEEKKIFGIENPCIIHTFLLMNTGKGDLYFTSYMMKNLEQGMTRFDLFNRVPLAEGCHIELLPESTMFLRGSDLLFASLSDSSNKSTVFISYEELRNQTRLT